MLIEYKPIDGFPGYRVGDDGSVWSQWRRTLPGLPWEMGADWYLLSPQILHRGHLRVRLYRNGESLLFMVHRLVLLHFVGPCPDGMEGCHDDGKPGNNAVGNLRWDTPKGNYADRHKHGTMIYGEDHHNNRLSKEQVFQIRASLAAGESQGSIARRFGVTRTSIRAIKTGVTWAWLKGEQQNA